MAMGHVDPSLIYNGRMVGTVMRECALKDCGNVATEEPWKIGRHSTAYFCEFHLAWLKRQMQQAAAEKEPPVDYSIKDPK